MADDPSYQVLRAGESFWRESNQMKVLNTDLAAQLGASALGARLWRLRPGEASTRHRHGVQEELYVLLEGRGRIRVGVRRPGRTGTLRVALGRHRFGRGWRIGSESLAPNLAKIASGILPVSCRTVFAGQFTRSPVVRTRGNRMGGHREAWE